MSMDSQMMISEKNAGKMFRVCENARGILRQPEEASKLHAS